mmetsp:Transcript_45288/g.119571  ORF Transcript_45288/g.119571 Transcript_45288/m.119571 type:complete len:274 (-) Transcript_45288:1243-2064(-)
MHSVAGRSKWTATTADMGRPDSHSKRCLSLASTLQRSMITSSWPVVRGGSRTLVRAATTTGNPPTSAAFAACPAPSTSPTSPSQRAPRPATAATGPWCASTVGARSRPAKQVAVCTASCTCWACSRTHSTVSVAAARPRRVSGGQSRQALVRTRGAGQWAESPILFSKVQILVTVSACTCQLSSHSARGPDRAGAHNRRSWNTWNPSCSSVLLLTRSSSSTGMRLRVRKILARFRGARRVRWAQNAVCPANWTRTRATSHLSASDIRGATSKK